MNETNARTLETASTIGPKIERNEMSVQVRTAYDRLLHDTNVLVDRVFAKIMVVQWLFGIACALYVSPRAWSGSTSEVHVHVWSAIFLGGLITGLPLMMTIFKPGHLATRLTVSAGQLMYSALLIHLMGGRIEAHFHIFMSLAVLAAYRDRRVFIPAVTITVLDHFLRGHVWPQSIFGVYQITSFRPFEHAAWVLVQTISMCCIIGQNLRQVATVATLQCSLINKHDELETTVKERTLELNNAKRFKRRILDSMDAEVCVLDMEGTIVFANVRWQAFAREYLGDESVVGQGTNYLDFCKRNRGPFALQSAELASVIEEIQSGKRQTYESECCIIRDNQLCWFNLRINQFITGDTRAILIASIDVTKTKSAEARAASLAKLVLESPNEVYIFSKNTFQFVEVNQGACTNLGYDRDTLLTMTAADIKPNYTVEALRELLGDLVTGESNTMDIETVYQRKDGTTYACGLSLHLSVLEDEEVIVVFATDLTQKKKLESQLAQALKLESVGQLAAGIAHEINTPMQCVFGNVEFLQTSFDRLLAMSDHVVSMLEETDLDWSHEREVISELREKYSYDILREQTPAAIQEASDASNRVISIIRAMKIMSHPGSTEKMPTDIHDMIKNAATITRSRWKDVATIDFDFEPTLNEVEVLPAEISQVFLNLIVNAGDAIKESIGDEPSDLGCIKVQTKIDGDWVKIIVSDTGSGIPQSVINRVFDPFFTTKGVGEGTGQGLSISRDVIVDHHSGELTVDSVEGKGTSFTIRIPRFPAPNTEDHSPTGSPAVSVIHSKKMAGGQPLATV